jgi:hypothetical protein
MIRIAKSTLFLFVFTLLSQTTFAQAKDNEAIQKMIAAYKVDMRGPYKDIRWYCADGTYAAAPRKTKTICSGPATKTMSRPSAGQTMCT